VGKVSEVPSGIHAPIGGMWISGYSGGKRKEKGGKDMGRILMGGNRLTEWRLSREDNGLESTRWVWADGNTNGLRVCTSTGRLLILEPDTKIKRSLSLPMFPPGPILTLTLVHSGQSILVCTEYGYIGLYANSDGQKIGETRVGGRGWFMLSLSLREG